ncbi:MAG: hypothetical protein QM775_36210 [Pirellulales bacterium]
MAHPRIRRYPHHKDYATSAEYRPLVMFTNLTNYRSKSLNTDGLGMRRQFDAEGREIDLKGARARYDRCNVLMGNSTAYGVDATSDSKTINNYLNRDGVPCVNLSIRGATSQQELSLFLNTNRFLPRIDNVVIFSGVINISLAAIKATLFYPEYGAIFAEKEYSRIFHNNYERFHSVEDQRIRAQLKEEVERWYERFPLLRRWAMRRYKARAEAHGTTPDYTFDDKWRIMADVLRNDLRTWGMLQDGGGMRVHYVLQPVMFWTEKPFTSLERSIWNADCKLSPSLPDYANSSIYRLVREETAQACRDAGIEFHDANTWFNDPQIARNEMFTDSCHLTDAGYRFVGEQMRTRLRWRESQGLQARAA